MTQAISEDLLEHIQKTVDKGGGIVAYARSKHINKGHVSMAYNGEYISPTLRLAMGLPNLKPAQTCTCGKVHTVPWCTDKKGAPVPETEKEIVYVEVEPEPKPKPAPRKSKRTKANGWTRPAAWVYRDDRAAFDRWLQRQGYRNLQELVDAGIAGERR